MRFFLAGALCAMSIAGCGMQSDDEMRASFRAHAVDSCVASSRSEPNPNNFDWQRLCGCAIDRYIAGKSASDLSNADPHDPALRQSTQQCAMEQTGGATNAQPPAPENGAEPAG
jgi:hypothetical protein